MKAKKMKPKTVIFNEGKKDERKVVFKKKSTGGKRKLSEYNKFIRSELKGKKPGTQTKARANFKAAVVKWNKKKKK